MAISLSISSSKRGGKWLTTQEILYLLFKILILGTFLQISNLVVVTTRSLQNNANEETQSQPFSLNRTGSAIGAEGETKGPTTPVDRNGATLNPLTTENTLIASINMQRSNKMPQRLFCSVRIPGKWRGPLMLITDTKENVAMYNQSFQEYCGPVFVKQGKPKDLIPIDATNKTIRYGRPGPMRAKRFKTLLWEYADSEPSLRNIEYIIYLDIDIIIASPLEDFLEESFARMAVSTGLADADISKIHGVHPNPKNIDLSQIESFISVIPQKFNLVGQMHTGVMMYHRHFSQYCLSWWRSQFDAWGRTQIMDQALLMNAPNVTNNRCTFQKLSNDWILFPRVVDMKTKRRQTIIHFTTMRAKSGSSELQQNYLLDIFGWNKNTPQLLAMFGNKSTSLTNAGLSTR